MITIEGNTLLTYYAAQRSMSLSRTLGHASSSATAKSDSSSSSTAPWQEKDTQSTIARDADIMTMTKYIDDSDVPRVATSDDEKLEQDNQKLYTIYKALDNLQYIANMATRKDVTDGQVTGYNKRFQECLSQIEEYVQKTSFNNLELQQAAVAAVTTGTGAISSTNYGYTTKTLVDSENFKEPVSGISESDSFTISVLKNGATQDVTIDMANVAAEYGALTLSNIIAYSNDRLEEAGVGTRLNRVQTGTRTDENDNTIYEYGIKLQYATNEKVTMSSDQTSSSLYLTGTSGLTTSTTNETTSKSTEANNQSRLVKLTLTGDAEETESVFSATAKVDSGNTEAVGSVTDTDGNTYILGTATGGISGEINQGTQDVYVSKYDSAGTLLWSHLIGSSASAEGYGIALDPTGGVVVAGSTTSNLTTSVAAGNENSFVAKFSASGSEQWVTQLSTRATNSATSVSVDASGNVTVGGTIYGVVGSDEANQGKSDAYLLQLDSKGKITAKQQFGTDGKDAVAATAYGDNGDLYVVSIEGNVASLRKYAADAEGNVDITADPTWTQSLGAIGSSGDISDLMVADGKIYIAGSTRNDMGGTANGNLDAFVMRLTDTGNGASTDYVTNVGTAGNETSGSLAIASDGTVYLTGSTDDTFPGSNRNATGTTNAFVAALNGDSGEIAWTKQIGGASGQSTGAGIAIVENNSSVLDALGLPTGTVQTTSAVSSLLTDETTVKANDTFKIGISSGSSSRDTTITIDKNETLRSLVAKINAKLGDAGEASISYSSGGKSLKITSASGYTLNLTGGAAGADVLAGLGISPGTLTDGSVESASANKKAVYGLGLSSDLEFSTSSRAGAVKAQVKSAMKAIQDIYQKINAAAKADSSAAPVANHGGTLSGAMSSYYGGIKADGALALSLLA